MKSKLKKQKPKVVEKDLMVEIEDFFACNLPPHSQSVKANKTKLTEEPLIYDETKFYEELKENNCKQIDDVCIINESTE